MMLDYQRGFGNHFASEALEGALPQGKNSPQRCAFGLVAEQLSGTAFTAPRAQNQRSWLYRIRPAAAHGPFRELAASGWNHDYERSTPSPNRLRWSAPAFAEGPTDFLDGMVTMAGNGQAEQHTGCAIHFYCANRSMHGRSFFDADGELLIVPQQGRLLLRTELGRLEVGPLEIAVVPRGVRFRVDLLDPAARGYVCENFGAPLRLPELGPIGSNGLAQARDFLAPVAHFERAEGEFALLAKFGGRMFSAAIDHDPLDVVAWHGNYTPYKYDLRLFNTLGSISFDHPDPSIFSVLQAPTDTAGTNAIDFVIFPPRTLVMQDTFRPPWYHRNVASEFMGLVEGSYDARARGFEPGGATLHNALSAHGPDADTFARASSADLSRPDVLTGTMAFMFETRWPLRLSTFAATTPLLQRDYDDCWRDWPSAFDPEARP